MIYFTSDLHFNHDREFIWGPRGFKNVEEMNNTIIKNWNSVVNPDDTVYVLGDLMLGGPDRLKEGLELINQLSGHLIIVAGNHDTDNRLEVYEKLPNVSEVCFAKRLKYNKRSFFLTHFPSLTASLESDPETCIINLHGHTHFKSKFYEDKPFLYNVGLDAHNNTPVSIDQILADFNEKVEECINQL